VETEDPGEEDIAAVPDLFRLEGREPAALLLVKAAAEKIHLVVDLSVGMIRARDTVGTLARMNHDVRHDTPSVH